MTEAQAEKPDWGLWRYRKDLKGGKYLVLRRDGTVFTEPNFVLGPNDRASYYAMLAYADKCEEFMNAGDTNYNPEYIADCRRLADDMLKLRMDTGVNGDPGKGRHRKDHPKVIEQMLNPDKRVLAPLEE